MISSSTSWWIAFFILLLTAFYVYHKPQTQTSGSRIILNAPAIEIGSWRCEAIGPQEANYKDPNLDWSWAGICGKGKENSIKVFLGYIEDQNERKKIASPRTNYPDDDPRWNYAFSRSVEVPLSDKNRFFRVNQTLLQHSGGQKIAVLYWYQMENESFSDEYRYRFKMMVQNLIEKDTRAVIVRLSVPFRDDSTEGIFLEEQELARVLYPVVSKYFFK